MDYAQFIVTKDETTTRKLEPDYIQPVDRKYEIWFYAWNRIPPLSIKDYSYSAIPKCLSPLGTEALVTSGILKLQNIPALSLKGQGVFIAIIDSGIAVNDSYNIYSIWDQTDDSGRAPDGFFYGTEYTGSNLPSQLDLDKNGHGTYVASVAGGRADEEVDFIGAAPESELIVVKLKPANERLKKFYFIPEEKTAYSEADIMLGIAYAEAVATRENRPLVICIALGCNNGAHVGSGPLSDYLSDIATARQRAVVIAAGYEANRRIHYHGVARSVINPEYVEIDVAEKISDFYTELWGLAPERFAVAVKSPTGAIRPQSVPVEGESREYLYAIDGGKLTIDYRDTGKSRRDQLVSVRVENASRGIWTIMVYPEKVINGDFDMWLPMSSQQEADLFFISPNPDATFTMPGDAKAPMTVGAYNQISNALLLDSGRGFEPDGWIKPDFLTAGYEVLGRGTRGQLVAYSGTSGAAALTAGACAQLLEWAAVKGNAITANSVDIKNLLIRGARRVDGAVYPSVQYGYGLMDVHESFRLI